MVRYSYNISRTNINIQIITELSILIRFIPNKFCGYLNTIEIMNHYSVVLIYAMCNDYIYESVCV